MRIETIDFLNSPRAIHSHFTIHTEGYGRRTGESRPPKRIQIAHKQNAHTKKLIWQACAKPSSDDQTKLQQSQLSKAKRDRINKYTRDDRHLPTTVAHWPKAAAVATCMTLKRACAKRLTQLSPTILHIYKQIII